MKENKKIKINLFKQKILKLHLKRSNPWILNIEIDLNAF